MSSGMFGKIMKEYEKDLQTWQVDSQQSTINIYKVANCTRSSASYEINLRCMLATYHLGISPQDIAKICSMLGSVNMP